MTRLLMKKVVQESALLFLACGAMLFTFCWVRVWIVCQFDLEQFAPLLKQFKPFERFSPIPLEQFLTYAGSIAMTFNEPVLIVCIVVWSIARGSDVVSGEIGRGTMEMLLSQPISRTRLLVTHATVCTIGLALLCFLAWLGIFMGVQFNSVQETISPTVEMKVPFLPLQIPVPIGESYTVDTLLSEKAPPHWYAGPTLNLFGFGFFVLAVTSMLSCFDRYRWRTIGFMLAVYVIQFLIFLLSRATDYTGFCKYLSFFALYQPDGAVQLARIEPAAALDIVARTQVAGWPNWLGPGGMCLMLVSLGLVAYAIGWQRFVRRDLPAPL